MKSHHSGIAPNLGQPVKGRPFVLAASMLLALAGTVSGGAVLLAGQAFAAEQQSPADTIIVHLDRAKLVKIPAGAETIVVGNPAIADVAVQKNGVMVITGRAAGRTNFIALDSTGTIISESLVSVTLPMQGRMILQRGLERTTYDCAPNCLPTISLGDDGKHFDAIADQNAKRDATAHQQPGAAPKR